MRLLLETTVLLIILHDVVRADISSEWTRQIQSVDESADEVHDAEILQAVVTSMEQWKRKHNRSRIKRSPPNSVCYEALGCFEDSGPFGYLEMLPSPPQEINTRFLLYSTRSRGDIPLLDVPFSNMSMTWRWADRAFNSSIPTKVIVHGFGSNCDHVWVYEMRSALMAVEECNVICVDWEAGAVIPNYVRAAANTRLVGKQLAMLLEGLSNHINLKFNNVHLIGFSLGAHVAGFAGSQLQNISRITGLDPAGPLFESQDPRARLDSTDAKFVDVIHSNGENLILGGLGSWQPMGHVDFYPNGGRMQTGCSNLFVGAVTDIIWSSAVEGRSLCNHRRAYKFFTDSVSPKCHFPSFPCDSYDNFLAGNCFGCNGERRCGNMGYYADRSTGRGQLYLLTRDEEPFCAHQYHVKVESSRSNQSIVSYGKIMLALIGDSGLNESFPMTRKDDSELILGSTISRMLVPHPALGIPIKVQLQYQAYSGWISSGLNQWTVDKVVLSDSFGKTSSICKKGLILNSGSPVILPLYPGDCNHPSEILEDNSKNKTTNKIDQENKVTNEDIKRPTFIPTQVVQIGDEIINNPKLNIDNVPSPSNKREDVIVPSEKNLVHKIIHIKPDQKQKNREKVDNAKIEKPAPNVIPMGKHFKIENENRTSDPLFSILDASDILNLPWQPLLANSLDNTPNERESGRAFGSINTKFPTFPFLDRMNDSNDNETYLEIVEPILKAPSTKNARSHDTDKVKKEITEPILGSTTMKIDIDRSDNDRTHLRNNRTPKTFDETSNKETDIYDKNLHVSNESYWMPSYNLLPPETKATTIWDQINKSNNSENKTFISTTSKNEIFSLFQWQNKNKKDDSVEQTNNSISSFTVQFLPSRLVSFLEKAESYARNTLLPLVSAYTPRFLLFGAEPEKPATEEIKHKYVPLTDIPTSTYIPIPKQSQQEKIEIVKNILPPNQTELTTKWSVVDENESSRPIIQELTTDAHIASNTIDEFQNSQNDPIKIVKAPDMTTTTLPSITLQSAENSSEKLIIVYPSNIRDDRKIQSHVYPEIMQFENLYQQSINQNPIAEESKISISIDKSQTFEGKADHGIHVDLPTYEPPTSTPYPYHKSYTTTPKFIPVSYPMKTNNQIST